MNSSGRAHGRTARRLVHAARKQDRRLAVALLAAAVSHTPEGEEVLRGARMRMARKPSAVARELLRNFPKGGKKRRKRNKRGGGNGDGENGGAEGTVAENGSRANGGAEPDGENGAAAKPKRKRRRRSTRAKATGAASNGSDAAEAPGENGGSGAGEVDLAGAEGDAVSIGDADE